MVSDLRLAWRSLLLRRSGHTILSVVSLGWALGVSFAVSLLFDAVLLRPLPLTDPSRVVVVRDQVIDGEGGGFTRTAFLYPEFQRVRDYTADAFAAFAASGIAVVTVGTPSGTYAINGAFVTAQYFDVVGVRPVLGRRFLPSEYQNGTTLVAILTHAFWRSQLGGDEQIIGRRIAVGEREAVIVGVLPRRFRGLRLDRPAAIFMPFQAVSLVGPPGNYLSDRVAYVNGVMESPQHWITLLARLGSGVGVAGAEATVATILNRGRLQDRGRRVITLVPAAQAALSPQVRTTTMPFVLMLLLAAGLMVLAGCANVAGGMLIRNEQRHRELAMRIILGSPRRTVLRLVFAEALVLASLGSAMGLQIAAWLVAVSSRVVVLPGGIGLEGLDIRWTVWSAMGLGVAAALLMTVLCGCVPALKVVGTTALNGGRTNAVRWRGAVVAGHVGLTVILLLGAALFGRSLRVMSGIENVGFETDGLFFVSVWAERGRTGEVVSASAFFETAIERLRGVAGLEAITYGEPPFLGGAAGVPAIQYRGGTWRAPALVRVFYCGPEYMQTLGLELMAGRDFVRGDVEEVTGAIVSSALARHLWGNEEPIGQWLSLRPFTAQAHRVIGVVRDGSYRSLGERESLAVFLPWDSRRVQGGAVVGRGAAGMVRVVQEEVKRNAPADAVVYEGTFGDRVDAMTRPQQVGTVLLGGFSAAALVLAVVGVGGAVAHGIACRKREIGIRVALGARRGAIVGTTVRDALVYAGVGGAVGAAVATVTLGKLVGPYLVGIGPYDAAAYATAGGVVAISACVGGLVPALWATRGDALAKVTEMLRE